MIREAWIRRVRGPRDGPYVGFTVTPEPRAGVWIELGLWWVQARVIVGRRSK